MKVIALMLFFLKYYIYGTNKQTIQHDNEQIMKEYENINISQCLTHDISNLNCQQKEITELNQLLTE